jgi:hypothetical protein
MEGFLIKGNYYKVILRDGKKNVYVTLPKTYISNASSLHLAVGRLILIDLANA